MALMTFSLDGEGWEIYGYHADQWTLNNSLHGSAELGPFPAVVPGAVQADLLAVGVIPNPYWEEQSRLSEWVAMRQWEYIREFTPPGEMRGMRVMLVLDGIDPGGVVALNSVQLIEHDGQFIPLEIDVTDKLIFDAPNQLRIILREAPHHENQSGWTDKEIMPHTRFTYKWDFSTRYLPVGVWRGVRLEAHQAFRVVDVWARPKVDITEHSATITTTVTFIGPESRPHEVRTSLCYGDEVVSVDHSRQKGSTALQEVVHHHFIGNPRLWWPNGYGTQHRYRMVAEVFDAQGELADRKEVTVGLREVHYLRNEGAQSHAYPYTLVVNGTPVFLKGWNLVPLDHLYGQQNSGKLRRYLQMVRDAGGNLLRVWGGGVLESEEFYTLCDELGILVWQDFIMSSSGHNSVPSADSRHLAQWEALAPLAIKDRRNHPSLAVWCGGNELMEKGDKPATEYQPVLALLRRLVREYDPDRLFLSSTPSGPTAYVDPSRPLPPATEQHDVHGKWHYLGQERHYAFYNALNPMLHSETGCGGAANLDAMQFIGEEKRLWPPDPLLWKHHAGGWIDFPLLKELFGLLETLEQYVQASQLIQAEGIRYIIESHRRRKWHTSGVFLWQLNEPWPNLACSNVIDYFGQPKPAYFAAANAFQPEAVSARYARLGWLPGDRFSAELFVSNSQERVRPLELTWTLYDIAGAHLAGWCAETLSHPNSVSKMGKVEWKIPESFTQPFLLRATISAADKLVHMNDYLFSAAPLPILAPLLQFPSAVLDVNVAEDGDGLLVSVENAGSTIALGVMISRPDGHWIYGTDNYRHLLPGETWTAHVTPGQREGFYMQLDNRSETGEIAVSAWNTPAVRVSVEEKVVV
ncbi:MAG: glycoside hydrolase family 2 protein [Armatimonadota bacterium]